MQSITSHKRRRNEHGSYQNSGQENNRVLVRKKINPASPPTTLEICGVSIHFPFRPYVCQKDYMTKVLQALNRSENALLESPTGTGKTLCLLCATLAWQRSQLHQLQAQQSQKSQPRASSDLDQKQPPSSQSSKSPLSRVPTIIYASRTHSQLSQVVRELRNTRYRPLHAVLASREQMCVHPKVKKPTATSSDINNQCQKLCKERKCRFRNALDGFAGPGSGETASHTSHRNNNFSNLNSQASMNTSKPQAVMDMEDLIDMGKSMGVCPFYYTRSKVETAELILVPYNYLFDKEARESTLQDVPWENSIVIFDEAHNLESFASDSASFEFSLKDIAGCIAEIEKALHYIKSTGGAGSAVPAGGKFAQGALKESNLMRIRALFLRLEEYIVNELPNHEVAKGGEFIMDLFRRGLNVTHSNFELFKAEVRKINELYMEMKGAQAMRGAPRLEHFESCLKRVFGYKLESKCLVQARSYRVHISAKESGVDANKAKSFNRTISYWCFAPALAMNELADLNVRSILVTSGTLSPLPSYSMELGLAFPHTLENPHIIGSDQVHVRVIGKGVTGKLLTSSYERRKDNEYYMELGNSLVSLVKNVPAGTLVFFPSYAVMDQCLQQWGGPSNKAAFGTSGGTKNSKSDFFRQRQKKKQSSSQCVFPQIPAAFYAANSSMNNVSIWKKLLEIRHVVLEPRISAELSETIAEYRRLLSLPKSPGCVLMGVCRGKISEGIDFADDQSRAVVITGIPFAPSMDAKVKLKREFLDQARLSASKKASGSGGFGDMHSSVSSNSTNAKLSGNDWYTQQAHRAVNQAVGRVIRSKRDYGAVLLLDSRFDQPRNQEGLSKWLRPHVRKDEGFQNAMSDLKSFYTKIQSKSFETFSAPPEEIELVVDDFAAERQSNDSNRVAVVRPSNVSEAESENSYIAPNRVLAKLDARDYHNGSVLEDRHHKTLEHTPVEQALRKGAGQAEKSAKNPSVHSAASRFMVKLSSFPSEEQAKIRKGVVAMNKSLNNKAGYLQSARSVISLLLKMEKISSPPERNDPRLLFTLLEIIPKARRSDVNAMSVEIILVHSSLGALAKKYMGFEGIHQIKSLVKPIMAATWFASDGLDRQVLSRQIHATIEAFFSPSNQTHARALGAAFISLLPHRWKDLARGLIDDSQKKRSVDALKREDKAQAGLNNVDMRRFQLPLQAQSTTSKSKAKQSTKEYKTGATTQILSSQSRPKSTGVVMTNPYQKSNSKLKNENASKLATNLMNATLEQIGSDTFVKPNPSDVVKTILSNAPKNMSCPLCSERLAEPFMADCGHLACMPCWQSWLQKSPTCPTCRIPSTRKELAKVVFRNDNESIKK